MNSFRISYGKYLTIRFGLAFVKPKLSEYVEKFWAQKLQSRPFY